MRLLRPLLILLALAAAAVPARADGPAEKKFAARVQELTRRWGYTVCRIGVVQYEPTQPAAGFAVLTKKEKGGYQQAVVFAWGSGKTQQERAFTTSDADLREPECPKRGSAWERGKEVVIGPWGAAPDEHYHLSVVDNQLVLLSETASDKFINEGTSWETLDHDDNSTDDEEHPHGWAMLPLLPAASPWRARLPRPRTWVTFGQPTHSGPADAALDVRLGLGGKALRAELTATDDVARPLGDAAAPDAAFLRADHFELWFCAAAAKTCDKKSARQLGVARLADGKVHARWLYPKGNKEPLPAVEPLPAGVAVTLPLAQLKVEGEVADLTEKLEGKLTAAYSDSDSEGKGQETLVATSLVRFADPDTFGLFVRQPKNARFPPWTGSAEYSEEPLFLAEEEQDSK